MIGSTIGPYRVVRKLGAGGMGAVYEAIHEAIERRVALKVLHAEYAANKELARRFFNEARAVNRVEHPGLVEIYDFGHFPDNKAYIVMELIKGETLAARLRHLGRYMPVPAVLWIGRQVADALAAAHAKNVIHRDLKPDNVMIISDPYVQHRERTKLLDFGIAKLDTSEDSAPVWTRPNTVIGTPAYMSPEQCRAAGTVDDKSDVYSFGILLYAMLTGEPPFAAVGLAAIVSKHLYEEPLPIASRAPWVPERLRALVHSLLKKDKEQRPAMHQESSELAVLLEQQPPQQPKGVQGLHHLPTASLSDGLKQVGFLSTLASAADARRPRVKPWRPYALKAGALCAVGLACGLGLPAFTGLMMTEPPPSSVIGPVHEPPPREAPHPPAPSVQSEASHPNRKRETPEKPTAIVPRTTRHGRLHKA